MPFDCPRLLLALRPRQQRGLYQYRVFQELQGCYCRIQHRRMLRSRVTDRPVRTRCCRLPRNRLSNHTASRRLTRRRHTRDMPPCSRCSLQQAAESSSRRSCRRRPWARLSARPTVLGDCRISLPYLHRLERIYLIADAHLHVVILPVLAWNVVYVVVFAKCLGEWYRLPVAVEQIDIC